MKGKLRFLSLLAGLMAGCLCVPLSVLAGFEDNGNGTISDSVTGLMWQQGDAHNIDGREWDLALDYCECLSLANYLDWRLPNVRELESIVAWDRHHPAFDTAYFQDWSCAGDNGCSSYWSSSTYEGSYAQIPDEAWFIGFSDGKVLHDDKTTWRYGVRCVRGGLNPNPNPIQWLFHLLLGP